MEYRPIVQRTFIRGINAAMDKFDQPKGTVPRASNLLYKSRGALQVCDGSTVVYGENGGSPGAGYGPITSIALFQATGVAAFYTLLQNDSGTHGHLGTPVGLILTSVNVGGGLLIPGNTYAYRVSAIDGVGGETLAIAEVSIVLGGGMNAVQLDWTALANAAGYRIYGRTVAAELRIKDDLGAITYIDDGTIAPAGALPGADTTQQILLIKPSGGNTFTKPGDIIAKFPAGSIPAIQSATPPVLAPSGGGGGSAGGSPVAGGGGVETEDPTYAGGKLIPLEL